MFNVEELEEVYASKEEEEDDDEEYDMSNKVESFNAVVANTRSFEERCL